MTRTKTTPLTARLQAALITKLTALADDELVLAHRNGEWVGHAPILEEDIALANLVQDELGHAQLWLALRADLDGSNPDRLAFFRDASEYRNAIMLELPRGDWAFTLLRQFLFDAYEAVWLNAARASTHAPLRDIVEKAFREERFHLQHTRLWVERLGLGTEESNQRTQAALDELWPHTRQLFTPLDDEATLVQAGIIPDLTELHGTWHDLVTSHLRASGLTVPSPTNNPAPSRTEHTEHLTVMLREMQEVARWDPEATSW